MIGLDTIATRILAQTTSPQTPAPQDPGVTPENVGPGVVGFIVTALIVTAAILLMVNMSRKIRRVRYREQVREEFEGSRGESPGPQPRR